MFHLALQGLFAQLDDHVTITLHLSPGGPASSLVNLRISIATYMGISYDFMWQKPMPYGHIIYLPVGDDLIRIYGHSGDGNYGLGFIVCRMNQQELGMVLFQKNDGWMMVLFWVMLAGFKEILTLCKLAVLTNQPAGWLVAEAVFAKPLLVVRSPWSSGLYLVNN